jgi:hypothetical protein
MMKRLLIAAVLATLAAAPAYAATAGGKTLTPQQQKMSDCSKQAKAKGLKGDERKAFMKSCLSKGGGPSASAASPAAATAPASGKTQQQQKMSDCSAQAKAKGLKGAERKTFMSTCLKGDAAPAQ